MKKCNKYVTNFMFPVFSVEIIPLAPSSEFCVIIIYVITRALRGKGPAMRVFMHLHSYLCYYRRSPGLGP